MASCSAMTAGAQKEEVGVVWCHIWSDSLIAFAVILRFSCSDSLRILGWGFSNLLYLSICCSDCILFVCRHFYFQLLVYITHPTLSLHFQSWPPHSSPLAGVEDIVHHRGLLLSKHLCSVLY